MIQTVQKTIKENKMKNCGKKCIVVLVALVIALGAVMAIMGCEAKKCTAPAKAPATTTVEKTTKTTSEKTTKK
jgi:flagellar basal body-associated protein FliL